MTKAEEINEWVMTILAETKNEDTTENRLAALQGLREAWKEDSDVCLEKTLYQVALTGEIMILETKIAFQGLR